MNIRAEDRRLWPIGQKIAAELGYTLVDAAVEKEHTDKYLRFYIDREGGVTFEDCEKFYHAARPLVEDVDYDYMEVSSPGVDKPLETRLDFERAAGQRVIVKLYKARDGQKQFIGELRGLEDGQIALSDGRSFDIKAVAQVVPEVDLEGDLEAGPAIEIEE